MKLPQEIYDLLMDTREIVSALGGYLEDHNGGAEDEIHRDLLKRIDEMLAKAD